MSETQRHWFRILIIWAAVSAIATPVVMVVWGPHMPPGNLASAAHGQVFDNTILSGTVTPIIAFIAVYFVYGIVAFRQPRDRAPGAPLEDGPPVRQNKKTLTAWIVGSFILVFWAAGFGSYEWVGPHYGAGSGQGPNPIAPMPVSARPLVVQVIAQQWWFNYRYPSYGGIETMHLELPVGRPVQFDVTSLDVVHSFWAFELGVKADGVPGAVNIAYTTPAHLGTIHIRCAELCGLWHGQMFDYGHVVSDASFNSWVTAQEQAQAPFLKYLPKYSRVYYPQPVGRGG